MDSEYQDQKYQPEESEFNMALAILRRVDNLLTALALYSQREELDKRYNILLTLVKEVSYTFNEEENKINVEYQKTINPLDKNYRLHKSRDQLQKFKDYGKLKVWLDSYESFIKKCLKERKMMLAEKSQRKLF